MTWTAGVDEAGRGPLAGPVVVAAVILDPEHPIQGLGDSKQLSEKKRALLFPTIQERAKAYHIEWVTPEEIDARNILQATLEGMRRAVLALSLTPDAVRIDGNQSPALPMPVETIVKGDTKFADIQAASILAKVARDQYMIALADTYPGYGFEQHKGYPTVLHRERLRALGPTPVHRMSFGPVKEVCHDG